MAIDNNQMAAIEHVDGPAIVLAGPGSGKTTVITHRVKYLIEKQHIEPSSILVITFTKAAANEMKERFLKLIGAQNTRVTFGTFHAVYFMILKAAYGYRAENIVTDDVKLRFMKEYIHRLRLEYDDENEFINSIYSEISLIKNSEIDLKNYYSANCGDEVFKKIYRAYEEFLVNNRLLDFDDMLVYCKELLSQREDILRAWQNKYRYILIDEFQDINQIQFDIIRMIAKPQNNIFIVGDDDQSIYRFRGAKPEIMLNFKCLYPDAKQILLDVNYRSGKQIVDHAGKLISKNKTRFDKNIRANADDGQQIVIKQFQNQRKQNAYLLEEIGRIRTEEGLDFKDIAILFRTNSQPGFLMEQLMDVGIAFKSKDKIPNIYDHWIANDIFAYMKIASGDITRENCLRVMNRPNRYLSRESLPYDKVSFSAWMDYYKNEQWMVQRLKKFNNDLAVIIQMRPYSAINYIRKGMAYEDYIKEYAAFRKIPAEDLLDVLDELQEHAKSFDSFAQWFKHIDSIREELNSKAAIQNAVEDAVSLCTLHSAKGLEFDTVFIVDVNEGVMPYKKAILDADLEEERRMFYVGMTRAKRRLYILYSDQINNKSMEISRFIEEVM